MNSIRSYYLTEVNDLLLRAIDPGTSILIIDDRCIIPYLQAIGY